MGIVLKTAMHDSRKTGVLLLAIALFFPCAAYAKRRAPMRVPPLVYNGIEYQARDMCFVEATDLASGKKLWRTKVYQVWYAPLAETDVQDVFINNLSVVDGKLQVQNERGKIYWLDLKSGDEEGDWIYRLFWLIPGMILILVGVRVWTGWRARPPQMTTR